MKQVSYVRPNNMKVNSKGDLSKEDRVDMGDLLFIWKQRRVSVHPPVAAAGTSQDCLEGTSDSHCDTPVQQQSGEEALTATGVQGHSQVGAST